MSALLVTGILTAVIGARHAFAVAVADETADSLFALAEKAYFAPKSDCPAARDGYEKAAERGHAGAMYRLGSIYMSDACHGAGPRRPNYPAAARWLRKAADRGVAAAMNSLSICHQAGLGVKRDPAKAQEWMRKAADLGEPQALMNLAGHGDGTGASRDGRTFAIADWLKKAEEDGSPEARPLIKQVLEGRGDTVTKDEWIRRFNNLTYYEWYRLMAPDAGKDLLTSEQRADYTRLHGDPDKF